MKKMTILLSMGLSTVTFAADELEAKVLQGIQKTHIEDKNSGQLKPSIEKKITNAQSSDNSKQEKKEDFRKNTKNKAAEQKAFLHQAKQTLKGKVDTIKNTHNANDSSSAIGNKSLSPHKAQHQDIIKRLKKTAKGTN